MRRHTFARINRTFRSGAFTLTEVMISIVLIVLSMGSILMLNLRSARILRASREVAAASQMLQQRVEMAREHSWSEVASSQALAALMQTATDSEPEMSDSNVSERMRVTVPKATADGLVETDRSMSLLRSGGKVVVEESGDFTAEPTLLFEGTATWRDTTGVHQRTLRTVICRFGLTRSGIVGTVIGRPGSQRASSAP